MKRLYNISGLLILTAVISLLSSCTNEINMPNNGGGTANINPVVAPDAVVWSGYYTLGDSFTGTVGTTRTRADEENDHKYDFPADIKDKFEFQIPPNIPEYNGQNLSSGTYRITAPYQGAIQGNDNAKIIIYIEKGAKITAINGNNLNIELYICEGGEVEISPNQGNWNIYNAGKLKFPYGIQTSGVIKQVYNFNELEIGGSINSGVEVYNYGGVVNFTANWEVQIMGKLISNNKITAQHNLFFNSNGIVDACEIETPGDVLINNQGEIRNGEIIGGTQFGQITCKKLTIRGVRTYMQKNGRIEASEMVEFEGGGSHLSLIQADTKGLIKCKDLVCKNDNLSNSIDPGIFINASGTIKELVGGQSVDVTDSPYIDESLDIHPKCGADPSGGNKDDDDDDDDDDDEEEEDPIENEVEINLALNDVHLLPNMTQKYDIADLVTKLSIHVRYPVDVEVIMPVPEQFYCNQDDLYILKDHYNDGEVDNWTYGGGFEGQKHTLSYDVDGKGKIVNLIIEYVPAADDYLNEKKEVNYGNSTIQTGGYISVKTQGINKDVIDYCQEIFKDGINFEVYNYYNQGNMYSTGNYPEITYKDLQYYFLSHSLVNFDWNNQKEGDQKYPDYYINAFNRLKDKNTPNAGDCYVWIWGDPHATINTDTYGVLQNKEHGSPEHGGLSLILSNSDNKENKTIERNNFFDPGQGVHFNESPYNWIYPNRNRDLQLEKKKEEWKAMPTDESWPFLQNGSRPFQYFQVENNSYWYYIFSDSNNWGTGWDQ